MLTAPVLLIATIIGGDVQPPVSWDHAGAAALSWDHSNPAGPGTNPYLLAYARAVAESKPLVVWVGGNFCARCVEDSKQEFVHHFAADGWNGQAGPATVIYAPYTDGLWLVGTVTRWTVGSHDWGHIPSARRLVHEWRRRADQGNLAPLPLLYLSGGHWGWPTDRASLPGSSSPAPVKALSRSGRGG